IEHEGTYPLPEAQVDRFMLKVIITYPEKGDERKIIRQNITEEPPEVKAVLTPDDIVRARHVVREVHMDDKIEQYIIDIIFATRKPEEYKLGKLKNLLQYGSSPRGSICLALTAKSVAFMQQRG